MAGRLGFVRPPRTSPTALPTGCFCQSETMANTSYLRLARVARRHGARHYQGCRCRPLGRFTPTDALEPER